MQAPTEVFLSCPWFNSAGGDSGSGTVQGGAMGRKVLKVDHHAVSQPPYGHSVAPITDMGNLPKAITVA